MADKNPRRPRRGGIFPALAVILFLATVIGFLGDMDPEKELLYAWENTSEAMSEEERFEFWRNELSKCIRCNACRNVCPACSCVKCIFDNPNTGVAAKASADDFEENMFHIIRAYHVAGRCTDCGECSRVCPQGIPLHLLNRKVIKDIDLFYGDYQAGESIGQRHPLIDFTLDDAEAGVDAAKGGKK